MFTDLEFQCDETPSVSWNREVEPWTERSDSPCCCTAFPMDTGLYTLGVHDDMWNSHFFLVTQTKLKAYLYHKKVIICAKKMNNVFIIKRAVFLVKQLAFLGKEEAGQLAVSIWARKSCRFREVYFVIPDSRQCHHVSLPSVSISTHRHHPPSLVSWGFLTTFCRPQWHKVTLPTPAVAITGVQILHFLRIISIRL